MSGGRWRRIEELFHSAVDLAPAERAAFLIKSCDGDDELRRQVEALLAQDGAKDNVLQAAIERAHRTPLAAGTRLGPYQIVAPIGAGGMGEVYRARDPRLGRDVALKILPAAFSSDPDRVRRFEQEGRAAATLNHPNILVIYDVGSQDGLFYAATELLDGETLRERLAGPALPVRKAIDYAIQIARGLAAAHAKGITHRDLKPENLFLTKDGVVKILDFGLARYSAVKPAGVRPTELATETIDTDPGMVLGTAGYMSPEQVRGQVADARSDLFSFGCVLYEMVSKERAFTGESSVEVMNAILKQEPPELQVALPPSLDRIIRRCLEKKPEDRFQTAVDLAFALESISGMSERKASPELRRARLWRYILPIALVAGACALAGAWWLWWPRHAPTAGARNLRQLTYDEGTTILPSLSPDAKLVTYQSDRADAGRSDIWVQQTSGGSAIRLTKGPGSHTRPAFSGDGSRIFYESTGPPQGIYEISALGGEPRLITADGLRPAVSPDGKNLAYLGPPSYTQVYVMPASGGEPRPAAQGFSVWGSPPIWAPDSQRIVFDGWKDGQPQTVEWWWVPLSGGTPQQVSWHRWASEHKFFGLPSAWLPGDVIVFWLGRGGNYQIYRAHCSSAATGLKPLEEPAPLTFGGSDNQYPSLAAGKMAFQSGTQQGAIWSLPADTNRGHVTGTLEKLTSEKATYSDVALTPDGKIMAFTSNRAGGLNDLYLRDMESGRERVLDDEEPNKVKESPLINGRGTELVYTKYDASGSREAFTVPARGGAKRKICDKCGRSESLSLDGKQFLTAQTQEFGVDLVDVSSCKTALLLRPSRYGIWQPRFSPDGKWISFITGRGNDYDVMLAPFRGTTRVPEQDWIAVTPAPAYVNQAFWSPDGGLLYYVIRVGGSYSLMARRIDRNGRPANSPIHVYEFTGRLHPRGDDSITAVRGRFVLTITESSFNIWMMDMPK